MKKSISLFVCLLVTVSFLHAQFNDYKYIVVPTKFSGFKNQNEHQTSTMVKYHIAKNDFNVIYDNALPNDLKEQRCLGLWVDLIDKSSLFLTKVQLEFKDCYGESVFITNEGKTKIKDYKGAYAAAIAQAASSLKGREHNYTGKKAKKKTDGNKDTAVLDKTPEEKIVEKPLEETKLPAKTEEAVTTGEEVVKDNTIVAKDIESTTIGEPVKTAVTTAKVSEKELLYAQPTPEGYQLVDTTPAVRYVLEATSIDDVFLVNQEGINGVVLKKENKWYLEYKGPNGKVSKELFIKF